MGVHTKDEFITMTLGNESYQYIDTIEGRSPLPPLSIGQTESRFDFGSRNTDISLNNREITVKILAGDINTDIHETHRKIAQQFYTETKRLPLVFSDDPSVYWEVTLTSIDVIDEVNEFSVLELIFDAFPLSVSTKEITITNTGNTLQFTSKGSYITYGTLKFTIQNAPTSIDIKCLTNSTLIRLKASTGNLNGNWEIDMTNRIVKLNGANAMKYVDQYNSIWIDQERNKFAIYPKENNFQIGTISANIINLSIKYRDRWL